MTSFEYRWHCVVLVLAGGFVIPWSDAPYVLRFYDQFVKAAPDELSTAAWLWVAESRESMLSLAVCYCGAIEEGERILSRPTVDGWCSADRLPDLAVLPGRLPGWQAPHQKSGLL